MLSAIYPPAIVVIMMSFFWKYWNKPSTVVSSVTAVAFLFGIIEALKAAGFSEQLPQFINNLPLNKQNLAWLLPSLVVLVIAIAVDRFSSNTASQN